MRCAHLRASSKPGNTHEHDAGSRASRLASRDRRCRPPRAPGTAGDLFSLALALVGARQSATQGQVPVPQPFSFCWAHLTPEDYRQRVTELVEAIESEARAELARTGRVPLGVAAILRQKPDDRPAWRKRSPAPLYHAATKAVRKAFWEAYATFVAAFREAADRWREGDRSARFPIGSFPPGLPFVRADVRPSVIEAL